MSKPKAPGLEKREVDITDDTSIQMAASSIVGQMGIPFQSVYCASKYAIEGYTESLIMDNMKTK